MNHIELMNKIDAIADHLDSAGEFESAKVILELARRYKDAREINARIYDAVCNYPSEASVTK